MNAVSKGFDPNQPRVPAGSPEGGRWTDGDAGRALSDEMKKVAKKLGAQLTISDSTVYDNAISLDFRGEGWHALSTFALAKNTVYFDSMQVDPKARGEGIARVYLRNVMDAFERLGVAEIKLSADDVGAYAWARFGFRPDPDDVGNAMREVRRRLDQIPLPPAVKQVAQVAADKGDLWAIADLQHPIIRSPLDSYGSLGKDLLVGNNWVGGLRLDDTEAMARFNAYTKRKSIKKYSPTQPRAPAGRPDGGRWVDDEDALLRHYLDHPDAAQQQPTALDRIAAREERKEAVAEAMERIGEELGAEVKIGRLGPHLLTADFKADWWNATRYFSFDGDRLHVHHISMHVDSSKRQGGIAKQFLGKLMDAYEELGVDRVDLETIQVGSYAWARFGFKPRPQDVDNVMRIAKTRLLRLADRATASGRSPLDRKWPPVSHIPEEVLNVAMTAVNSGDTWAVSDLRYKIPDVAGNPTNMTLGYHLLESTNWQGSLDMRDPEAMARFNAYTGRVKKAYNPNQPREPKGVATGGRWTSPDSSAELKRKEKERIWMSGDDESAVYSYVEDSYDFNRDLRSGRKVDPVKVESLDKLIGQSSPFGTDVTLYRGVNSTFVDKLKPGDVMPDKAYLSTTSKKNYARDFFGGDDMEGSPVLMTISVPKGSRAMSMVAAVRNFDNSTARRELGYVVREQREFVFPRGSRLRIDSVSPGAISATYLVPTEKAYDPNQPRHPKGTPFGGRWRSSSGWRRRDFNEDWVEYERDAFADLSSSVQAWHGTTDQVIESVLAQGLVPSATPGADAFLSQADPSLFQALTMDLADVSEARSGSVFLTSDPQLADRFGAYTSHVYPGSKRVIFEINIPQEVAESLVEDEATGAGTFRHLGKIPPEWISRYLVEKTNSGTSYYALLIVDGVEKAYDPNQPRRPKGDPRGGQWVGLDWAAPSHVPADGGRAGGEGMRDYVKMIAEGLDSKSYQWYLGNGQIYEIDKDTFIGGKVHQCYKNVFHAMMVNEFSGDEELTYVEGFVSVHGVPIHHAWAVTKDGKVRDYTIPNRPDRVKGIQGYFGVPLKWDAVKDIAMKTRVYGVTPGHENWEQILSGDIVAKAFNPNQPRKPKGSPEGGQWVGASNSADWEYDENGELLYHGTGSKHWEKIKKEGIKVVERNLDERYYGERGRAVYVTTDLGEAVDYAFGYSNAGHGSPVVLQITLPPEIKAALKEDMAAGRGAKYLVGKRIKPEWITAVSDVVITGLDRGMPIDWYLTKRPVKKVSADLYVVVDLER